MAHHKFKTEKESKKSNVVRFLVAFLAFAVVFGAISAYVIITNGGGLDSMQTKTTEVSDTTSTVDFGTEDLSGQANILIYCCDSSKTEMYFLALVNADMDKQIFNVYPLNFERTYGGSSYIEILAHDGYKTMIKAVEANEKITIDKYISSNAETFALAVNYMNGLEYNVAQRIEYRNDDYTLILTQGKQTIKGETLLKYLRYCNTLGNIGYKNQGDIFCTMLDEYINTENVENGITIYQKILSKINSSSDISHIEVAQALKTLTALCNSDDRQPSIVVLSHVADS